MILTILSAVGFLATGFEYFLNISSVISNPFLRSSSFSLLYFDFRFLINSNTSFCCVSVRCCSASKIFLFNCSSSVLTTIPHIPLFPCNATNVRFRNGYTGSPVHPSSSPSNFYSILSTNFAPANPERTEARSIPVDSFIPSVS